MRLSVSRVLSAVLIFCALLVPVAINAEAGNPQPGEITAFRVMSHPHEGRLRRGRSFDRDLRTLPQIPPEKFERPEFEAPAINPGALPGVIVENIVENIVHNIVQNIDRNIDRRGTKFGDGGNRCAHAQRTGSATQQQF